MKTLQQIKSAITNYPMPFGLKSSYGVVYGWTLHEQRYMPEQETIDFFTKHLTKEDTVADIGANIGLYTLLFAHHAKNVVSFEPSPAAFKRLRKATKKLPNIELHNVGIFSKEDRLKLYYARPGDPMGSMMYARSDTFVEVPVYPLAHFGTNFTWAKIDVEGAEIEVLKGMGKRIPAVLEVARGILETYQGGIQKFFSEIELLGYSIHFITAGGNTIPYMHGDMSPLVNNIYIKPTV